MICQQCGTKMSKGYIPAYRGRLHWFPEGQGLPWIITKKPKGSVVLSDYTHILPKKADAYYCKVCSTVIVPVNEQLLNV